MYFKYIETKMQLILLIPLFFYMLSGICDSVMDTCMHHFSTSIFKNKDESFWNTSISWKSKYLNKNPLEGLEKWKILGVSLNKPVQLTDSFHLFKMLREIYNVAAITTACWVGFDYNIFWLIGYFMILGMVRNLFFNIFYEKILRS